MRKALLVIAALAALSLPGWASFTLVQHPSNVSCASGSATCAVTTSATGSGNLIVVVASTGQTAADAISSVSGGGTYTHCSNCSVANSSGATVDASYTL